MIMRDAASRRSPCREPWPPDKVAAQAEELARLAAQIEWFKKQLFGGGKSETQDSAQLRSGLDEKTAPVPPATQRIA
jgi:hypothetical protein